MAVADSFSINTSTAYGSRQPTVRTEHPKDWVPRQWTVPSVRASRAAQTIQAIQAAPIDAKDAKTTHGGRQYYTPDINKHLESNRCPLAVPSK